MIPPGTEAINFLWFFVAYSFLGWCIEVIYGLIREKRFVNRNFLTLPVLPIYGAGGLLIISLLYPVNGNLLLLFAGSFIIASVLEYFSAAMMERVFRRSWWNYSKEILNVRGRISLKYSFFWGALSVVVIKFIHPHVASLIGSVPVEKLTFAAWITGIVMLLDITVGILTVVGANKRSSELNGIDRLIEDLSTAMDGCSDAERLVLDSEVKELKEAHDILEKSPIWGYGRILKDLPPYIHNIRHSG